MQPISSNGRNQTLGPHPEEAALLARPSRRMAAGTISLVAVLRDARKSALLRTRLMDEIGRNPACKGTLTMDTDADCSGGLPLWGSCSPDGDTRWPPRN